jgi:hypothetical protein
MQNEVLAHPGEQGGEHHEHSQCNGDYDQGALGAVDYNLVDDHLGEQRCHQAQQLDDERGDQHVAPDALVFQQFGDEPVESERGLFGHRAIGIFDAFGFECELECSTGITCGEFRPRQGLGGVGADLEQDDALGGHLDDDGGVEFA